MKKNNNINEQVTKEAIYGTLPILSNERQYGLFDAFLILSGYAIATWCYTQGAFMAQYTSFWQLITSTIGANTFIIALYMLPVLFASRYGIDMWQWMKSIFGTAGAKVLAVLVVAVNFPWFGVCADIFGSTIINLFGLAGIALSSAWKPIFGLVCVFAGSAIAIMGPVAIKWANRIIVPLLFLVGIGVFFAAFTAVPVSKIVAFKPDVSSVVDSKTAAYACAIEAGFAAGFSWCCSTAVAPRLCKKERDGYWATVGAYGIVAPIFDIVGGILAIAMFIKFGIMSDDIASILARLCSPKVALLTLALVVFANIATHGTGAYMWAVVLKSSFPKVKFSLLVIALGVYAGLIVCWGQIMDYFGAMITYSTFLYGPIMAILFVDYFFVRKRKVSLRGIYELKGHDCYRYTKGYNIVGVACVILGTLSCIQIFDGINYSAKLPVFNYTTSSFFGFVFTAVLYFIISRIPAVSKYLLKDREGITV